MIDLPNLLAGAILTVILDLLFPWVRKRIGSRISDFLAQRNKVVKMQAEKRRFEEMLLVFAYRQFPEYLPDLRSRVQTARIMIQFLILVGLIWLTSWQIVNMWQESGASAIKTILQALLGSLSILSLVSIWLLESKFRQERNLLYSIDEVRNAEFATKIKTLDRETINDAIQSLQSILSSAQVAVSTPAEGASRSKT